MWPLFSLMTPPKQEQRGWRCGAATEARRGWAWWACCHRGSDTRSGSGMPPHRCRGCAPPESRPAGSPRPGPLSGSQPGVRAVDGVLLARCPPAGTATPASGGQQAWRTLGTVPRGKRGQGRASFLTGVCWALERGAHTALWGSPCPSPWPLGPGRGTQASWQGPGT